MKFEKDCDHDHLEKIKDISIRILEAFADELDNVKGSKEIECLVVNSLGNAIGHLLSCALKENVPRSIVEHNLAKICYVALACFLEHQ